MRNHVRLVLDLTFDGDYYSAGELVEVASGWIEGGLTDRDDLDGVEIAGIVNPGPDVHPVSVQPCRGDAVEEWVRHERDKYEMFSDEWNVLDNLLYDYRIRADCGELLNQPTPFPRDAP